MTVTLKGFGLAAMIVRGDRRAVGLFEPASDTPTKNQRQIAVTRMKCSCNAIFQNTESLK